MQPATTVNASQEALSTTKLSLSPANSRENTAATHMIPAARMILEAQARICLVFFNVVGRVAR